MARQEALKDKIAELRKQGFSRADSTKQASENLRGITKEINSDMHLSKIKKRLE